MDIRKSKKGFIANAIKGMIIGIVGIVVILLVLSALVPTLYAGTSNISASGLPMASLFATIIPILIVVAVLIGIIVVALAMFKGGNKNQ
jgi:heme/copper-type cytochrome/quinol oxidase subunit 2